MRQVGWVACGSLNEADVFSLVFVEIGNQCCEEIDLALFSCHTESNKLSDSSDMRELHFGGNWNWSVRDRLDENKVEEFGTGSPQSLYSRWGGGLTCIG